MRITIPGQHIAVESSPQWSLDEEQTPDQRATFGLYLRSVEFGIYVNVRGQDVGATPLTQAGMRAVLREQSWASPPFDEWSERHEGEHTLVAAGGVFEMTADGAGEVVLEAFMTDGRFVANLATPGDRKIIAAATPEIMRLCRLVSFV